MEKIFLILLAAALSSCGLRGKISVVDGPHIRAESVSRMVLTAEVENRSRHTLRIVEGRFRLHALGGDDIATAIVAGETTIPRRTTSRVELPLRVRFNNPLAALGSALSGSEVRVSGEAVVRVGAVRKKIRVENSSVSDFLNKFISLARCRHRPPQSFALRRTTADARSMNLRKFEEFG